MDLRSHLHEQLVVKQALGRPRIIMGRDGSSPYLSRFYLRGKPTMPDGGEPFDQFGNPYPEAKFPDVLGVYVHLFHQSDDDGALHSPPWEWSAGFILAGGYVEYRRDFTAPGGIRQRIIRPGSVNRLRADDYHRVDLLDGECWTLFVAGPKTVSWSFWDPETGRTTPWRQFLQNQRAQVRA